MHRSNSATHVPDSNHRWGFFNKEKWIAQMKEHGHYSKAGFIHPLSGKMTKEKIGYLAFKHIDHTLRQFNC